MAVVQTAVLETVKAEIDEHQEAIVAAMRERDELQAEIEKREAAVEEHGAALKTLQEIERLAAELPANGNAPTGKEPKTRRAAPAGPPRQPTRRAPAQPRQRAGEASGPRESSRVSSPARRPAGRQPGNKNVSSEKVLDFIRRRGAATSPEVQEEFNLQKQSASYHLGKLIRQKQIVDAGRRGPAPIYRPVDQVPPADKAEHAAARQEPALEGRILQLLCHRYLTKAQIAPEVDAPATDVDAIVAKLEADGDVERLPDGRYRGHE